MGYAAAAPYIYYGITAAAAATSAYGSYQSGQYTKEVYEYNAAVARQEAEYQQQKADIEAQLLQRQLSEAKARQRAIAGKSGTAVDVGSNLTALLSSDQQAEIDARLLRYGADINSWRSISQAGLQRDQAGYASRAGNLQAGTTILESLTQYDWRKTFEDPALSKSPLGNRRPVSNRIFGVRPGV